MRSARDAARYAQRDRAARVLAILGMIAVVVWIALVMYGPKAPPPVPH